MKEKLLSFLLAAALTACLTAYLFYHVGLISWMRELSATQWVTLAGMIIGAGLLISQGYRFIIQVRPWDQGHVTRSMALLTILTGTLAAYTYFLDVMVQDWLLDLGENTSPSTGSLLLKGGLVSLILSLLIIWIDYSWFAFARYSKETIHRLREERNKKELQFNLLRSQLTPHFLFNSLNTASYLATSHPDQAEEFIRKLAFNFTNLIRNGIQPLNSLERELEIVDNYMHLMKVRYGDKVLLEKRVKAGMEAKLLPALGIQLLVENAMKHNVASLESPLKIMITAEQQQVVVTNTLTQKPEKVESTGIGLRNLKERYLHHGRAIPTVSQQGGFYEVHLPYVTPKDSQR
ncbi:histidine kinase [Algoriphagus sp. H41]|uniref:Histidine kinase n=1 Tax=Algoriphagus oliviformis TaxID=2811231 RepID=A0ABS3C2Q7_9BACT|nr:histidine kinase [Algoriphagus oliviformis]MBN7811371.1 histidine kinase [Algoriphagus oliviformis]